MVPRIPDVAPAVAAPSAPPVPAASARAKIRDCHAACPRRSRRYRESVVSLPTTISRRASAASRARRPSLFPFSLLSWTLNPFTLTLHRLNLVIHFPPARPTLLTARPPARQLRLGKKCTIVLIPYQGYILTGIIIWSATVGPRHSSVGRA